MHWTLNCCHSIPHIFFYFHECFYMKSVVSLHWFGWKIIIKSAHWHKFHQWFVSHLLKGQTKINSVFSSKAHTHTNSLQNLHFLHGFLLLMAKISVGQSVEWQQYFFTGKKTQIPIHLERLEIFLKLWNFDERKRKQQHWIKTEHLHWLTLIRLKRRTVISKRAGKQMNEGA